MRPLVTLLTLIICLQLSFGQNTPVTTANYSLAARFSPDNLKKMVFSTSVSPHWMKNSNRFWYSYETSEGKFYYVVNPAKKTKKELFDRDALAADMSRLTGDPFDGKHLDMTNMKFIKDETAIRYEVKSKLVKEEEKDEEEKEDGDSQDNDKRKNKHKKMKAKTWFFEYNLSSKELKLLEDYEKPKEDPRWATLSPDSSYVLFARNHNLYWMDYENYVKAKEDEDDTTIVEHQWTEDGEEYFSYAVGGRGETNVDKEKNKDKRKRVSVRFSPNSRKFTVNRTDVRHVKDLWVINSIADPRPTLETYKYQMPGEKENPIEELKIFDFDTKESVSVKIEEFPDQTIRVMGARGLKKNRDDDFRPGFWLAPNNDQVYFSRTSRDLKRIDICVADANTGEVKVAVEERLNIYIDITTPMLVDGGKELIHWSERDGWAHLYLYDDQGNVKNQITKGPWHVSGIEEVDEKNRVVYFTANGREKGEDPYYTHLYRIKFDGSGLTLLDPGDFDHRISMNDENTFFVDNYSRVNTTPQSDLYNNEGEKVMELETADLSLLMEAGYQFPEPFKAKAGDGITDIYGVIYKPFDFDPDKKYPLIEYVYPGPQTEAVYKSFSARMDRTDRLAQLGFVVITLGNRGGHPARSKWYHSYGYKNLRDYGLEDKKVVAEQLSYRHDYIDINKVGIFGHSGGGFMSTAAMLVYPDFFKVAVSSAGNHDNAIYNRWWSEKHHGVDEIVDDEGNVSFKYDIDKNPELAKNLKGKLLLATGDIDNNVHPGGTIRVANALIKANKRFDFFLFPGKRHGFGDMNEYFFWLRGDYFVRHLMGDKTERPVDMLEMNMGMPRK
jgi:dipeptidyl-peptidase-4